MRASHRRIFCAWLALAALVLVAPAAVRAGEPLKPYVVLALDTSGSMIEATNSGPPTCGGDDTRINHARCAINNIVNSYGDMEFALGRFRMKSPGTPPGGTPPNCTITGPGSPGSATCDGTADMFELLTPLIDGNNDLAARWTDGTFNTCSTAGSDPEIFGVAGNTPLAGSLVGVRNYFMGLQGPDETIWPANEPGFSPIANDPTRAAFLPDGCDPSPSCTGANCCAGQCRPYVVILLTDGAETCVPFNPNTTNAAAALLATDVATGSPAQLRRYRIETKPIGFGVTPPNPPALNQIEQIAHAGGAPNSPTRNEGFYAADEAGLQLAISRILDDAIRTESCNNADDDCDTAVDEDFPNKGGACDNGKFGACRTTGELVCSASGTGVECDAPDGPDGTPELCNQLDDDCDGKIDEGLNGCTCFPQGEQCNNADDDCDTRIDEDIQRPCGTGTCQGVETCSAGVFGGCTAPQPSTEVCNGLDDNCDGVRDGFAQACSTMPATPAFPAGHPRNNPGDPANAPIPQNICHPGSRTCPANVGPPNAFGACLGEQQPLVEVCNNLDDDCDNVIDEDTGGADCSSDCGVGTTVCVNGALQCDAVQLPSDDTCDGIDDDCDNLIDEDYVSPGTCGTGEVCNGQEQCLNGVEVCVGMPVAQESCNCTDDDCDVQVDEGAVCPPGTACVSCQCAAVCASGEFPCPLGKICVDDFCLADPCFGVTCPVVGGAKQICQRNGNQHACVSACDPSIINCPPPFICYGPTGECRLDNCTTFPDRCGATEICVQGACVANPCAGVECAAGEYCLGGACFGSCGDVECPDGQRCRLGMCEADPCGEPCPFGRICNEERGECVADPCRIVNCVAGQECDPQRGGACVNSPCVGTTCPNPGEVCRFGTCYDPADFQPDGGVDEYVTTGGGGGCTATSRASLVPVLPLLLIFLFRRRRRRALRAGTTMLIAIAITASSLSCSINEYCIGCDPDAGPGDGGFSSDGGDDAMTDGGLCVPGLEVCDAKDNDCDGKIDEGPLPEIGDACANQQGACAGAVKQCVDGAVSCTAAPRPEICDLVDNNCNGTVDEGNPGGGGSCGTDVGECVAGVTACASGAIICIGRVDGGPETCNGRDDDCDARFDEGLANLGACGATDAGECSLGTQMCVGGGVVCVGATGPTFELCDALDQDCDGDPTNGFDLETDPVNCGACGNTCELANAFESCTAGDCTIAACQSGFHDNDGLASTGCEFGPCTIQSTQESCNGVDDNCNGAIDEGVALPPAASFCLSDGECAAGTTVSCDGAAGVRCHYADPDVSLDPFGGIAAETLCDGKDNDCDGAVDEGQPNKGQACDNAGAGDCRSTGSFQCDPAAPNGPAVCVLGAQAPGPSAEVCDGRDNNCNGIIDDDADEGDLPGQTWVEIPGSGFEIMKYEASRPDASAAGGGALQTHACSRAGVQPWTNVTHPQAVQACASIGARLCTEVEWEHMCGPPPEYPVAGPATAADFVVLEAEDAFANVTREGRTWLPNRGSVRDFSGVGFVEVGDGGVNINNAGQAPARSARLDFRVALAASTQYVVWVRMFGQSDSSDSVWAGISPTQPGTANNNVITVDPDGEWRWVPSAPISTTTAGNYFASIYLREDGTRVDAIAIARQAATPPPDELRTWAYATGRKTPQPQTCNGDDFDTTPGGADDDAILPTGSLPQCFANGPGTADAFDMSGNVKEWTSARAPGQNPIRGGASNNETTGLTCGLNFTLANDAFFFPNVGFRCCR